MTRSEVKRKVTYQMYFIALRIPRHEVTQRHGGQREILHAVLLKSRMAGQEIGLHLRQRGSARGSNLHGGGKDKLMATQTRCIECIECVL